MNIYFARAKAGHDKNQIYFILKEEKEFVYLVNGITKSLDCPKKKKRKHIQVIQKLPDEIRGILEQEITNESVKRSIKLYVSRQKKGVGQTAENKMP